MLLLGIDLGTSSVKVAVIDTDSRQCIASASFPETEAPIISYRPGWAEQKPGDWWEYTRQAILKLNATAKFNPRLVQAIGIAYQMHGLVTLDRHQQVVRDSIIWCDSRAVPYGDAAFRGIGQNNCLHTLLNSPGNFTAAKLAWVKDKEPGNYERIATVMLPGDYICFKLTGSLTTTPSALSEAVLWNFPGHKPARSVMEHFEFDEELLPPVQEVFSQHGVVTPTVAEQLGLTAGIPVTYKAGDQPNNALSLNVMTPGEAAANAGTSGVIYAVTDQLAYDPLSRINSFAHVNHRPGNHRVGVLLCINGAGITSSWVRKLSENTPAYARLNKEAEHISAGADGLIFLPFGNGAERMLNNRVMGAQLLQIDFNQHTKAHIYRACLEGVACAFRYGLELLSENDIRPSVIRAAHANMFLSDVFTQVFVNTTGIPVELYETDGSVGAALGAGIGLGLFSPAVLGQQQPVKRVDVNNLQDYQQLYYVWKQRLENLLQSL